MNCYSGSNPDPMEKSMASRSARSFGRQGPSDSRREESDLEGTNEEMCRKEKIYSVA